MLRAIVACLEKLQRVMTKARERLRAGRRFTRYKWYPNLGRHGWHFADDAMMTNFDSSVSEFQKLPLLFVLRLRILFPQANLDIHILLPIVHRSATVTVRDYVCLAACENLDHRVGRATSVGSIERKTIVGSRIEV